LWTEPGETDVTEPRREVNTDDSSVATQRRWADRGTDRVFQPPIEEHRNSQSCEDVRHTVGLDT